MIRGIIKHKFEMQVAKSEYKIKGRNGNYVLRLVKSEQGQREKKMCRQALETDAVEVSAKMVANCRE